MIMEKPRVPDLNFFNFPRIGYVQRIARFTDEIHFFEIHIVVQVEFVVQHPVAYVILPFSNAGNRYMLSFQGTDEILVSSGSFKRLSGCE